MFLGEYPALLDEKRRLYLPKKIRLQLGNNNVVLTRGFENCIFGWCFDDWEKSNKTYLEKPITDPEARNIRRYLFSGASVCEIDRLGRTILPDHLAKHCNILTEVMLIGAGDHFEIWNKNHWQEYLEYLERE